MSLVLQGTQGYANEDVAIGDYILSIDGVDVREMPIEQLHHKLSGEVYSTVDITLQVSRS